MLLFLLYETTHSQNLIPNGGFEQYSGCPNWVAQLDSTLSWFNPTFGSPDYFNSCDPGITNVPNSLYGYQSAHGGMARSGLIIYSDFGAREYIEVPLTSPLIASQCYYFEMYVSMADNFKYSSDALSAYFSDTIITGVTNNMVLPLSPQINNTTGYFDTLSWRLVSGTYTATGGESYLLIGNFLDDANTNNNLYNPVGTYNYAYVYIDDVSLSSCTGTEAQGTNARIKIYPNPVSDRLTISINNHQAAEFTLYTIYSEVLIQQSFTDSLSVNTTYLTKGIYMYEVRNKNVLIKKGKLIKN